jgi:hypothetical protein
MHISPQQITEMVEPAAAENGMRLLVLGVIYAVAAFVAIAFSPTMGFVTIHHAGTSARLIASDTAPGLPFGR